MRQPCITFIDMVGNPFLNPDGIVLMALHPPPCHQPGGPATQPRHIAGDEGEVVSRIGQWLWRHGIAAIIPQHIAQLSLRRGSLDSACRS
jgi:hypothetical protein